MNKLEQFVSRKLKEIPGVWYQKNMVMPLAHKQSVGDFIVLTDSFNYVLECKEVKNLDDKGMFELKRLSQLQDLIVFESKLKRNKAFVVIMFYGGNQNIKWIFAIPLSKYCKIIELWGKKSFNFKDMMKLFNEDIIKNSGLEFII